MRVDGSERLPTGFRGLAVGAAVATYLLIVAGGIVRVTGSGLGCGERNDWPLCRGGLLPPLQQDALIEFSHRWLAATSTALVLALAAGAWVMVRRRGRSARHIATVATAAVVLFGLQIVLGGITVKLKLPGTVILLHLANALLLLGSLVYVSFLAFTAGTERGDRWRSRGASGGDRSGPARLAAAAAIATYGLVLSGALVVAQGAGYACAGWPLCGSGLEAPIGDSAALNLAHRLVAAAVVLVIGLALHRLRRTTPSDPGLRAVAITVMALVAAQVAAGALVVELRLPAAVRGIHLALASALWAATVLLALLARTSSVASREQSRLLAAAPS